MRIWRTRVGRNGRVAALALAAGMALTAGSLTPAARADDAAVANATQVDQLATSVDQLRIDMLTAIQVQGEAKATSLGRDAMRALLPRLDADLPAPATPEAVAAHVALAAVAREYIGQFGIAVRRAGLRPLAQATDLCRLMFYTQARTRIGDDLARFDAAADVLSAQSGVAIAHLSGKDTPQWHVDRDGTGVASLCILTTVVWGGAEINKAAGGSDKGRYLALTKMTARTMTRALAFLKGHEPAADSPYRPSWRAAITYASAQRAWQAVLRENAMTGKVRRLAAAKRLQASLPGLQETLVKDLQAVELLPVIKNG